MGSAGHWVRPSRSQLSAVDLAGKIKGQWQEAVMPVPPLCPGEASHTVFNFSLWFSILIQEPVLSAEDVHRLCIGAKNRKSLSVLKKVKTRVHQAQDDDTLRKSWSVICCFSHRDTPSTACWAVWAQWPACVLTERRRCCCGSSER